MAVTRPVFNRARANEEFFKSKVILLLLVVALLLLCLVVPYMVHRHKTFSVQKYPENTSVKKDAVAGQVVSGFPNNLILDPKATVQQSYSMAYADSTQYTVSLQSAKQPQDLYAAYLDFFKNNKYTVQNKSQQKNIFAIYAVQDNATVNVAISKQNTGSAVVISYSVGKNKNSVSAVTTTPVSGYIQPIIKDFPQELWVNVPGTAMHMGYKSVPNGNPELTLNYNVSASIADEIKVYTSVLSKNGWQINSATANSISTSKNTSKAVVVFNTNHGATSVSLTYDK